jgi:hypothetical protein
MFCAQRMKLMFYKELEYVTAHTVSYMITCPVPGICLDSSTLDTWMDKLFQDIGNQLPTFTA